MNKILAIFAGLTLIAGCLVAFPDGVVAMFIVSLGALTTILIVRRVDRENTFLIDIFLVALIVRILFGLTVHLFDMREFFAGDSMTYDFYGNRIAEIWSGRASMNDWLSERAISTLMPGWGINYLAAVIYMFTGHNMLAAQSFCAVIGAATAPLVYICSHSMFQNRRVGKLSAFLVALFPGFIIWSSQLLKDGLIIFLLVLSMTMVLRLQKKFDYISIIVLIASLGGILSLRFYIFYMVVIAVGASFVIGRSGSVKSIVRGFVALVIIGLTLTYLGIVQTAGLDFDRYANLERIQMSRSDLARSAESGFGETADVSNTEGVLAVLPIGFMYLMFAPFPWQVTNFRQAITLPEMMVWWASFPLLISGLWYTIRNRLRNTIAILIFTMLLTLGYSVFQGNVGTAYRQRAQIQVFLFIFIAVGWTLRQENKEARNVRRGGGRPQ